MAGQRSWWIVGLLLVALLGAGGAAWRWLQDDAATVGTKGELHARAEAREEAPPDAAKATRAAAALHEGDAPQADDAAAKELPAGADVRNGVALTVVRHEDGAPVGDALLVVLDARHVPHEEIAPLARDPGALRKRASFLLHTDGSGLAHVPRPVASSFVVGIADGRRGCIGLQATSFEPLRLELFTPRSLDVRVVDERGVPQCGVEVAFRRVDRPLLDAPLHATTGAEGTARLDDLDLATSLQRATQRFAVGFALPLVPPVSVAVDLDRPPEPPVVLTLPATGALAFQVVDAQGQPLAADGALELAAATSDAAFAPQRQGGGGELETTQVALDEQGRGTVAHVGLRLRFQATPRLPDRSSAPLRFAGPSRAGETVDVALPADAIGPLLTGRVVADNETPLAGAELDAELDAFDAGGRRSGRDRAAATVAADGSFRLDWSRSSLKGRECQLFLRATRSDGSVAEAGATATLPAKGIVELGTIRLAPPPLLAAGQVVDDEAEPLDEAVVRVEAKLDPPLPFKVNHLPRITTGHDGTFELRGALPDGKLELVASRSGYLPMKPLPIEAGARDLILTLRMGGTLSGSLRLPDGFPNDLLNVRLTLPAARPPLVEVEAVRQDGRFRFPLLATGLWDFEVLLGRDADHAEPIDLLHEVAVHAAEVTRDERMQELDLLTLVRVIEATVRLPGGALAEKGAVGRSAPGPNQKTQLSVPLRQGRALVPCTSVPVALEIVVPGFLAQSVAGVDGPVDVTLRSGLPVRFVVSGRLERQPGWIPVRVTARPKDAALAAVWPGDPVPLTGNEASLLLPAPGRYRARIEFGPPPDSSAAAGEPRQSARGMRSDVEFDVKESEREQVIELDVKQ